MRGLGPLTLSPPPAELEPRARQAGRAADEDDVFRSLPLTAVLGDRLVEDLPELRRTDHRGWDA